MTNEPTTNVPGRVRQRGVNESAIPDGWVHEDELGEVSKGLYDAWYPLSRIIDGVRMGPPLRDFEISYKPAPPVEDGTHEFKGHSDAPQTWCVVPVDGTESGYCGRSADAPVHKVSVPHNPDPHSLKRFALSGQCDNRLHSECGYPDRCLCACHRPTEPQRRTSVPTAEACMEHCGWCNQDYDFFTQSIHCPHNVKPQSAAPVSEPPARVSITPLLQKIIEICDAGSAQEFGDADERLRAIRMLIIGEAV